MSDITEYKCPNCLGQLEFNSKVQKMKCPFCDSEFEIDEIQGKADTNGEVEKDSATGMTIYKCQSCGGEIIADGTTGASSCPYCDSPIVMVGQFADDLQPDLIIPFKLDKKAAKEALFKHFEGKKLLPRVFKDQNHVDEIKGLYVPMWLYDQRVFASANYDTEKERRWSDSDYDYVETKEYRVEREGNMFFEHVPVNASTKMDAVIMESLEPFDYSQAVSFKQAYLAGYMADRYDKNSDDTKARADERTKNSAMDMLRSTVKGYDRVSLTGSNAHYAEEKKQYVLYPIWLLNTSWRNQKYVFAMNGQTGKFVGNLPSDKSLVKKYFLKAFAIGSVVGFAILELFALLGG